MDAPHSFSFQAGYEHRGQREVETDNKSVTSKSSSKRKRLAKACDACHRSKRRCDGTAPCSNCYFASKPCQYTDASGRLVPAPNSGKPDASKAPRSSSTRSRMYSGDSRSLASTSTSQIPLDTASAQSHKRAKAELPNLLQTLELPARVSAPPVLDHALTRELTNLFFTHCHPIRDVIHRPSFSAALSHRHVPSYLLYAICAVAAPLSHQPRIRTAPARFAGQPFAREAVSQMLDASGHLLCDSDLFTAQALCLLVAHGHITNDMAGPGNSRYRNLALQIAHTLGLHESDPVVPVPTAERIQASIERESVRRIFWVIHIMDLYFSVHMRTPPPSLNESQLRLRLPIDETSFELQVQSTLPEYLHLTRVSELGHLIRIMTIFAETEQLMNRPNPSPETVADVESRAEEWVSSLPDHLRFSEENLQVQKSMFETSSNTGAWCFCCMHIYYASFVLALHAGRSSSNLPSTSASPKPQWTVARLDMILNMLGERAKNTWMLVGAFLWTQVKYCNRDNDRVREWCNDYEELWGTRILDSAPQNAYHSQSMARGPISPTYSMGRSLNELRLQNPRSNWSSAAHMLSEPGLTGSRGDLDITSRRPSTSKGKGQAGESLPSLKASGLLDSWKLGAAFSRTVKSESDARPTSMPAGLPWLAKEPR